MSDTATDTIEEIADRHINGEPRKATFSDLIKKPRRKLEFTVTVQDEEGKDLVLSLVFQGLGPDEYDDLIAKHPPTQAEKHKGAVYNAKTFPSALISAVSYEPRMDYAEVEQLRQSAAWSQGEFLTLFFNAQTVCSAGLDVPFNARG